MSFESIPIVIDGLQKSFLCSPGWTVGDVKLEIRDRYLLSGGGIDCDGLPTKSTDVIAKGHLYTFTDYDRGNCL